MRNLYAAATAATLTAALCASSLIPAVAEEKTPLDAIPLTTGISAAQGIDGFAQNLEADIQRDGDTTTVKVGDKTTVVTTDPESGDMLINSDNGQTRFTQSEINDLRQSIENETVSSGITTFSGGVETDWKKYLCAAAAEAAVTGHGTAWQKAIELATKSVRTGKANPWLIAASALFHFGAGVFLGVQC